MKRILTIGVVLMLSVGESFGQDPRRLPEDTLAWVSGSPILARELRARIELMPWPEPVRPSTLDSVKSHALSSMVAERLLATEAALQGLSSDRVIERLRWGLTNVLLKDELFRREVVGRVKPTKADIDLALRRYQEERSIAVLLTSNRADAESLAVHGRRSRRGSSWPPALDRTILDRDTVLVRFGMTDTLLERLAYEIGPSRFSSPRRMGEGRWVVLQLLDRTSSMQAQRQNGAERERAAIRILEQRLDSRTAEQFYRSALSGRRAAADSAAFHALADLITEVWSEDTSRYRRPTGYEFTSEMVDVVHQRLGSLATRTLVTLDEGSLTVERVVEMFRYEPFVSDQPSGLRFLNRLNEQIQKVAAGAYLVRMAHQRSLISAPSVQADLRSWSEYWAAGEMLRRMRDTVRIDRSDLIAELLARRELLRGRTQVRVQEVWSVNASDAAAVLEAILRNEPMAALASTRAKRSGRAGKDGVTDWFDPTEDPEVGFRALLADTGALVGPVPLSGGLVTFRVLGVRSGDAALRGRELERQIVPAARSRRAALGVNAAIADMARRHQVRIEPEAVKRTSITVVPMFTRRYLGFGGWMNGAPQLIPVWEWVRELPPSSAWPL